MTFADDGVVAVGRTVTASESSVRSGVRTSESTLASGTGSIQTVCQMPLVGVYQMPLGLADCLPTAYLSSVVSFTFTSSVCCPRRTGRR